ncbi:hypothetical protein D3C83_136850 [compost metagenome]
MCEPIIATRPSTTKDFECRPTRGAGIGMVESSPDTVDWLLMPSFFSSISCGQRGKKSGASTGKGLNSYIRKPSSST